MKYKTLYPVVISFLLYVNVSESVVIKSVLHPLIAAVILSSVVPSVGGAETTSLEKKIRDAIARINTEGRKLENDPSRILNQNRKEEVKNPRPQREVSDCEKENEESLKIIDEQKKEISELEKAKDLLLVGINSINEECKVVKKESKKLNEINMQLREENKQLRRRNQKTISRLTNWKHKAGKWQNRSRSSKKQGKN